MQFISVLENVKIYIKNYIKIADTCFGLRPSSGSLDMSLAKVILRLCGSMLPNNRIIHNDVLLPI